MSEITKIEWATSTGNPWIGCSKVSPGCKNCYAETLDQQRFSRTMGGGTKEKPVSHWGPGAPRVRTKAFWRDAKRWNVEAWNDRLLLPDLPRPRIFPSLCDWLDEEVPIEWLADFLKLIHETPHLDWLLLSKRPENFRKLMLRAAVNSGSEMAQWICKWYDANQIPTNVWIGTSVEDQKRADERIPELLKIPAKIRFLSVEPLLGPVNLNRVCGLSLNRNPDHSFANKDGSGISWVIVGGESGPGARPCNSDWVRSLIAQCKDANVPCFVKQLGANVESGDLGIQLNHPKGGDPLEWPEYFRVREFPV